MTPKKFLMWAGYLLLVLGILGFILPGGTLIPDWLVFDMAENWAHLLLGVVALAVVYGVKDHATHKWLAALYGVVALVIGIWGFLVIGNPMPNFYGISNLENPLDNLVHLVVGVWGLWAAFGGKEM